MRYVLFIPFVLIAAAACQSTGNGSDGAAPVCVETGLEWAIGQPYEAATLAKLKQQSGAGILNPIGPKSIVSKDNRPDRLRVFFDKENIITTIRCG